MNRLFVGLFLLILFMSFSSAAVVINEFRYNPPEDSDDVEYIEIYNSGEESDLSGWQFSNGIKYNFPDGTKIQKEGYLVISRSPLETKKKYGVDSLGPYEGSLDNGGETIEISSPAGSVNKVKYDDDFPWPSAADGEGSSLELVSPNYDNNNFMNWRSSNPNNEWKEITFEDTIREEGYISLPYRGEIEVKEFKVFVENSDSYLLLEEKGNYGLSGFYNEEDGSFYRINSFGEEEINVNYISIQLPDWIKDKVGKNGKISFKARVKEGSSIISFGFFGGENRNALLLNHGTPGMKNSVFSEDPAPYVSKVDSVEGDGLYVLVTPEDLSGNDDILYLTAEFFDQKGQKKIRPFYDNGKFKDGQAGDGVWGVRIFENEYDHLLKLKVVLGDSHQNEIYFPQNSERVPYLLMGKGSSLPSSPIPSYEIIISGEDLENLNRYEKKEALFYNGDDKYIVSTSIRGARRSGGLNIKFLDRDFDSWKEINLAPIFSPDELIVEKASYELYSAMGVPSSTAYPVRIYVNGEYSGNFMLVEEVDKKFLEKNGFEVGNLYKSESGDEHIDDPSDLENLPNNYPKITNKGSSYDDLIDLLKGLDSLPKHYKCTIEQIDGRDVERCEDVQFSPEEIEQVSSFFNQNFEKDRLDMYLAVSTYISHTDSGSHNHYLFHNPSTGKWQFFPWDLELTSWQLRYNSLYGAGITDWYKQTSGLKDIRNIYPSVSERVLNDITPKIDEFVRVNKKEAALQRAKRGDRQEFGGDLIISHERWKYNVKENKRVIDLAV